MASTGTLSIGPDGPVLSVAVGHSAAYTAHMQSQGRWVPAARPFDFLIDTGASICVVDPRVVAALSLRLRSGPQATVVSAGAAVNVSQYDCSLSVADATGSSLDLRMANVIVSEIALSAPYAGLIGRPFLRLVELVYNGPAASFSLSW